MLTARVSLGSLRVSRLMVGGNPFSGMAHQPGKVRNEMLDWYTTARIHDVLGRCEAGGVDTFIGRADQHIMRTLREYWNGGGTITWIAQTAPEYGSVDRNIREAADAGAKGIYLHGGWAENLMAADGWDELAAAVALIRSLGLPAGVAGHYPERHLAAARRLDLDFQMVCCYRCGSLHAGLGETFDLADVGPALAAIGQIPRPCVAYKVLGAGRVDPAQAFPRVLAAIKPGDAVLVGLYTRNHPSQVEDTIAAFEAAARRD